MAGGTQASVREAEAGRLGLVGEGGSWAGAGQGRVGGKRKWAGGLAVSPGARMGFSFFISDFGPLVNFGGGFWGDFCGDFLWRTIGNIWRFLLSSY